MRVLLVEDDLDLAQFIRKGLKEEQYAVDFAADGEEGWSWPRAILTICWFSTSCSPSSTASRCAGVSACPET